MSRRITLSLLSLFCFLHVIQGAHLSVHIGNHQEESFESSLLKYFPRSIVRMFYPNLNDFVFRVETLPIKCINLPNAGYLSPPDTHLEIFFHTDRGKSFKVKTRDIYHSNSPTWSDIRVDRTLFELSPSDGNLLDHVTFEIHSGRVPDLKTIHSEEKTFSLSKFGEQMLEFDCSDPVGHRSCSIEVTIN